MVTGIYEIRFHGRGGQGAKTAAVVLAKAALEDGEYVQAFPEYGPERQGAPLKVYFRASDSPILIHSAIVNPDVVAVIEPSLTKLVPVLDGIKENGIVIINTPEDPATIRKQLNFHTGKVVTLDATKIAFETIGLNIPNGAVLGALIKVTNIVKMECLKHEVVDSLGAKKKDQSIIDKNMIALDRGFNECKIDG